MTALFDTSSLLKKYIEESGYNELDELLVSIEQIIVSPTFLLEAYIALERRFREKNLSNDQRIFLRNAIKNDMNDFIQVDFNQQLYGVALGLIERYPIATLDSIQLSSAVISRPDIFVTSDKKLFVPK